MNQPSPRATSRLRSVFSCLLLAACAASPLGDPAWKSPSLDESRRIVAGPADRGAADQHGRIPGGFHAFDLVQDRDIDGTRVPAGTRLFGLEVDGSWVAMPRYTDVYFWRSDFALVKRFGQGAWHRLDVATGTEEPMPFPTLAWARQRCVGLDWARAYGSIPDPDDPALCQVWLLDDDWRVVRTLRRVRPGREEYPPIPQAVETLAEGAYVVHHVGQDGKSFDVIYDRAGRPMSPELEPLARFADGSQLSDLRFAVKSHPLRELYWPLGPDGRVQPKPANVLGLRPVYTSEFGQLEHAFFAGWIAHFAEGDGERLAWCPRERPFHAESADREAVWSTLVPQAKKRPDSSLCDAVFVAQRRGDDRFVVLGQDVRTEALAGVFALQADALAALAGANTRADAAYQEECRRYWAELREREEREKRAVAEYWENRAKAEAAAAAAKAAAEMELLGTIRERGAAAGLAVARAAKKNGQDGWQDLYATAALAAVDSNAPELTMDDLITASDGTRQFMVGGRLRDELERRFGHELRRMQAPTFQPMSAYFGSPAATSSRSSSPAPTWTGPSVGETLSNARWQSQLNFLSGQSSCYWGNNGLVGR